MNEPQILHESELPEALSLVLAASANSRASATQVRQFRDYLQAGGLRWSGWRVPRGNAIGGLVIALLVPGRTAVIMPMRVSPRIASVSDQQRVVAFALESMRPANLHYAQALVEPSATLDRSLLMESGFTPLARLEYLERDVRYPWTEPPSPSDATWVCYGPSTRTQFQSTILETYEQSLDCPELAGIRPIEDVLDSHQATGVFSPDLWELAVIQDRIAGCVLATRLPEAEMLEVVYMGVTRAFRGRGVGDLLLRRALDRARQIGIARLTLVVDSRNAPARRLYDRAGLKCVTQRDALLYRWDRAAQEKNRTIRNAKASAL